MDEYSLPNVPKRIKQRKDTLSLDSIEIIDNNFEISEMTSAEQYIYEGMNKNFEGDNE